MVRGKSIARKKCPPSKKAKENKLYSRSTNSGSLAKCKEWILKQNTEQENEIDPFDEDLTENTDETITESAASLSHLKHYRTANIKQGIYFVCEWKNCGLQLATEDELSDHVGSHIVELQQFEEKYCCDWDLCYFKTDSNSEIARHINYHAYHTILKTFGESICQTANIPRCTNDSRNRNSVPDLKSDFTCEWDECEKKFKSIYLFHKHIRLHCHFERDAEKKAERKKSKNIEMIPCKWDDCEATFKVVYRLVEHIQKHVNAKIVGCHHCGSIFRSNTILFNHCKRQILNNTQEFQCEECYKYFATEPLLRHHVAIHVNCVKCTMCNMTCQNSYTLARHVRYRHLSERPFSCAQCKSEFVSKSDLERHIGRMHAKKIYECGEIGCDFSCKTLFRLKKHDAEIHGDSPVIYACHCEKIYKSGRSLSRHLIKVHGFQLPSGHSRFLYRLDENGTYRLQTMRIESLEVTKQILSPTVSRPEIDDEVSTELVKVTDNDFLLNDNSSDMKQNRSENNILITISDVDKDGNIIDTKYLKASEIKLN